MSFPVVYNWPAIDNEAICLAQKIDSVTGGNLSINGNLTVNSIEPGNAILPGISRTISLTSTGNLSAVSFTINGVLNSSLKSEIIAGPNAATVETASLFDRVISVSSSANFLYDVSVGTGTTGQTHWYSSDYNRNLSLLGFQVIVNGTIDYSVNESFDNVQLNPNPAIFGVDVSLVNATDNQLFKSNTSLFNYINCTINSSAGGSLVLTILQTGT